MKQDDKAPHLTCEEAEGQKARAAELIAQDRQKLLGRMPFIGGLLMRLDIVPVYDERLETAATDGDHIYFDIVFYSKLDGEERLFVLAHEAWHCALIHFMRRQDRDPKLFNVAADLEIHFILTDEKLKAPFVLPHDPSWKGLSAEEIYEMYPEFMKWHPNAWGMAETNVKESENISRGQGSGDGGDSFDRHLGKEGEQGKGGEEAGNGALPGREGIGRDPDYNPYVKSGAEERCRERLTAAVQQYERTRGTLPDNLAVIVRQILAPEINWRELLAQFVTSCYGGSRRWLPPARRHVWEGLYLQSQCDERLKAVVAIDTSGSTVRDLPKFFGELNALLNTFGGYDLTVLFCDTAIAHVERSDDANPIDPNREWESYGGGGTSVVPVFDYVDQHPELEPSLLVYFTDGCGDAPERAPRYPVMWLLTKDGKTPASWGTVVKFKERV